MSAQQCFYVRPIVCAHLLETLLLKWSGSYKIIHERWVSNAGNKRHTCLFLAPFPWHKKVFSPFCFAYLEENL